MASGPAVHPAEPLRWDGVRKRRKKYSLSPVLMSGRWNAYGSNINESVVKKTVQLFETLGLKDAGYEYINLDDGWSELERTSDGVLQANAARFPDGMANLADYVHSKGLKIGLYGDSGMMTCAFHPGSLGYEERDALTLAEWEIDYLKYDNCGGFAGMVEAPEVRFGGMYSMLPPMNDALKLSGRDIMYALCEWGYQFPWHWGGSIGHSYRISGDITPTFINETGCPCKTAYCLNTGYAGCSVVTIIKKMREISQYQTFGHWADMDGLEIGNANMTFYQQQTHFAFWAALKSPLIISTDLATLSNESTAVLTNKNIIALNQDSLGQAVNYIETASTEGSIQVWAGKIQDGFVVLLFNEKNFQQTYSVSFHSLGLNITGLKGVKELWSGESYGKSNTLAAKLAPYQTLVFKLLIT
ncbi:alpha-galactosidase/alpha-n-acetylgalactosaminidase [Penicillium riverlandense]|uniref:alpha-galactosidase/alpha-n- acetylgalactosaminidase n=1 Tax=Penicillium riverlandense TaxID=1903569 RepID=UPI002548AD47|nr:alpha-galactosidase/alpha-n-acetylgalactosaminidase [Penicillium riverlandense]KAJ5812478.1 alpha-galactosidase/alpha-n-acetylgalactosaminidase [Penicillium riverlandense]